VGFCDRVRQRPSVRWRLDERTFLGSVGTSPARVQRYQIDISELESASCFIVSTHLHLLHVRLDSADPAGTIKRPVAIDYDDTAIFEAPHDHLETLSDVALDEA
jgi:hypothetical protein